MMPRILCCFLVICFTGSELRAQTTQTAAPDSLISAGHRYLNRYLTSRSLAEARRAHSTFSAALRRQRSSAEAKLGLGLVYAAVEGRQIEALGVGDVSRITNNTLAIRYLTEAIAAGADARVAAPALRNVVLREFTRERTTEVAEALAGAKPPAEAVKAVAGELFVAVNHHERVVELLQGATTASARRVLGIALLFNPRSRAAGAQMYLAALADADSLLLREFVLDARWLADIEEAARWLGFNTAELKARLNEFWERRAAVSAVPPHERLASHFARVVHARDEFNFYRQRLALFASDTASVDIDTPPQAGPGGWVSTGMNNRLYHVDDRAFIYVRYGEPDERITTVTQILWNDSWIYRSLADRVISFDFFLPTNAGSMTLDARGWTLIYDVMHCGRMRTLPYIEAYVRDRQHADPRYSTILARCGGIRPNASDVDALALPFARERRDFLRAAVVRDNAVPKTRKNIPLLLDVLQFKAESRHTDITAVVAWPLAELTVDNQGIYRARLSFVVSDTLNRRTISTDTMLALRPGAGPAPTIRVHLRLRAEPGNAALYRITLRDLNDSSVTSIVGDSIDVRSFDDGRLTISDLALAGTGPGNWVRLGERLALLPRGVALSQFRLYYEIYGVSPASTYKTTVTITPQTEALAKLLSKLRGKRAMTFEFVGTNQENDDTVVELRSIGTELPSGLYTMRIDVTAGQRTASRERLVRVP
jgi:hypothetical protein